MLKMTATKTGLKLTGRLTINSGDQLDEAMARLDPSAGCTLDFSEVSFLSSAGLRCLIIQAKRFRQARGTFKVVGVRGIVKDVLLLAHLDKIMTIETDE